MRVIATLMTLLVMSSVGVVIFVTQQPTDSSKNSNTYFTNVVATRDRALLDQFLQSLDPEIMRACVAEYDAGGQIDLDYLATCGDFDTYARYMRISKFEAVKKFEYVLLHSSSKLEFEDRLAR